MKNGYTMYFGKYKQKRLICLIIFPIRYVYGRYENYPNTKQLQKQLRLSSCKHFSQGIRETPGKSLIKLRHIRFAKCIWVNKLCKLCSRVRVPLKRNKFPGRLLIFRFNVHFSHDISSDNWYVNSALRY